MKKYVSNILVVICILVAVCLIPFPKADVNIWLYMDELGEETKDSYEGFYTLKESENVSASSMRCVSDIENKRIKLTIDGDIAGNVSALRIDFPCSDELLIINNIAVSSGGFIQKQLDPSRFLTKDNIIFMNDITGFSDNEATCRAAIHTGDEDPYIVLSDIATAYLMDQQSNYLLTRAIIVALLVLGLILYKKINWGNNIYTA